MDETKQLEGRGHTTARRPAQPVSALRAAQPDEPRPDVPVPGRAADRIGGGYTLGSGMGGGFMLGSGN